MQGYASSAHCITWCLGINLCTLVLPDCLTRACCSGVWYLTWLKLWASLGTEMQLVWALRMAAAWHSLTSDVSSVLNLSGVGNLLGADQNLRPEDVTASSGNVKTSCAMRS